MLMLTLWFVLLSADDASDCRAKVLEGIRLFDHAVVEWSIEGFSSALVAFDRVVKEHPSCAAGYSWSGIVNFHLVSLYQFGLPSTRRPDRAAHHIEMALDVLERAVKLSPDDGESYALLATLKGMKIALKPVRAVWLGPGVKRDMDKALALAPSSPRVHYLLGMSYFHAPALLGGKEKSREHFARAIELFAKEHESGPVADTAKPRWGYSECLTFSGRAKRGIGEFEEARADFARALELNPGNVMARDELLAVNALLQSRAAEAANH